MRADFITVTQGCMSLVLGVYPMVKWKLGDAEMFRRMFRPSIVMIVIGFIISLILAPKPGVHIIKVTPHITDVVVNSGKLTVMSLVFGTLSYAFLGGVIEFVYWLVKRGRMNADRSQRI